MVLRFLLLLGVLAGIAWQRLGPPLPGIAADSLGYLSIDGLLDATHAPRESFCTACLTGDYPTRIEDGAGKFVLEPATAP